MPRRPVRYIQPPYVSQAERLLRGMLKDSDLEVFVELVRRAEGETTPSPHARPDTGLRAAAPPDGLLHRNELACLRRSLKIAPVAGAVPDSAHRILHAIFQDLSAEGFSYLPLTHSKQWLDAIAWALSHPASLASDYLPHSGRDRQFVVGTACRALRDRGYGVNIGALGPRIDAETCTRIAQQVDALFAQIGGIDAAGQLCRIVHESGKVHAGMWLLGNVPARIGQPPQPALPFGWLLSIALQHIHVAPSVGDPAKPWKSAVDLAIDFAASTDCQRYNQFDGLFLDAPDFLPALAESLVWRELFTLPQVPPSVLPTLRDAFVQINWPNGTDDLRRDVDALFCELGHLLESLSEDGLTVIPQRAARFDFALLWRHACAPRGNVNAAYLNPFGAQPRDHDRYVFFEADGDRMVVLPASLTVAAACEAIFRLVWARADPKAAERIVGDTIEKSVSIACRRTNSPRVWEKFRYRAGAADLEIDVAVRDAQQLVLFEAKAKPLTSKARTGDTMAFIFDYTNSFLALVRQLVRHERNIRRGLTPLTRPEDAIDTLRVTKVAVSPLCYGPSSDHVLAGSLFRSIVQARLHCVTDNAEHAEILDAFNKKLDQITRDIEHVGTDDDGQIDLFGYLIDLFWLDLGQLLYALHRGRSLVDALSALRSLTFGTQDFWTEAAFADRQGLTNRNWHPIPGGALTC